MGSAWAGPPASTVTTVSSGSQNNTSSYGASVTFTATVNPAATDGTTVSFYDNGTYIGIGTLFSGTATYSTSSLAAGTHSTITAAYSGDGSYAASTSLSITQTVSMATASPLTFAAKADYGTGTNPASVTIGDFNGDGKLDLAAANNVGNTVSVLLGNGDGTFAAKVDYGTGTNPQSVTTGDFNGDGKLDLAVVNSYNSTGGKTVSVLLGNGNGTFAAKVDYSVGNSPVSVTTGDFNGDGKLDLAVANSYDATGGNTVSVLLGNGNGTFAAKVDYATGHFPYSVTVGDFNGDGKMDLAVANRTSNTVSILIGNGNGTFATKVDYGTGTNPASVTTGDFNGDGVLDLAAVNSYNGTGGNTVSVLLGNGNGTFAAKVDYGVGTAPISATTGDFNGDGKLDLAVANYSGYNVSVLLGNGNGTFAAKEDDGVGNGPYSVTTADFNGDGRLDLATANYGSSSVSVLLGSSIYATVTAVSSSPNPSAYGASVTLTATVTPSAATGTVTFKDGAATLGTGSLTGGIATYSTSALSAGTHSNITAAYGGDSGYAGSTSTATAQVVDNIPPTSAITTPTDGAKVGNAVTYNITGTASDTDSGVQKVEVSTNNGGTWSPVTSGTTSWSYTWTLPADGSYTIRVKATDNVGNVETPGAGITVIVDKTSPTSTFTFPGNGPLNGTTRTITGTASDTGGSGLQKVEVSTDNGGNWHTATGTTTWSYTWTLPVDGSYSLKVKATDNAGNVETPGAQSGPYAYIPNADSNNVSVINTDTNTVVATVPVGAFPIGVAVNPSGTRVYVTNMHDNSISVINTATNTVVATVGVGYWPCGIAVNPSGTRVYVTNVADHNVSVIDTSTNTVIATVAVGSSPYCVAVNPSGTRAYVVNDDGDDKVSVINTATNTIVATIWVGSDPREVVFNPSGTRAYVANIGSNNVSVINTATNTVVATIGVGKHPRGIAVNPSGTRAYVTNMFDNNISVINTSTNTVVATIGVGGGPASVAVNPSGTSVYVTNLVSNDVSVINTFNNTVVATIGVGISPEAFGQFIAAVNLYSLTAIVDNTKPSSSITSPVNGAMLNAASRTISGTASDNLSGVAKVEVGVTPDGGSTTWYTASGRTSWSFVWPLPADGPYTLTVKATDNAGNVETPGAGVPVIVDNTPPVTVITSPIDGVALTTTGLTITGTASDNLTGVKNVEVSTDGGSTWNLATGTTTWSYSCTLPADGSYKIKARATDNTGNVETPAATKYAYIPNVYNGNVSVIDTSTDTVVTTVRVGGAPYGAAVNPSGTRAYVTNWYSGIVSVIDTSSNTIVKSIRVGYSPIGVAVNQDGTRVYVANSNSDSVSVIDTSTNTVVDTVMVGADPQCVAVNPSGTKVYVTNWYSDSVSVIDTSSNTLVSTIEVGAGPFGVLVDPSGTSVYVANGDDDTVSVIDVSTDTVIGTIPVGLVGSTPIGLCVNPSGTRVYVANSESDDVSVIDTSTNTEIGTVKVGSSPVGVAVNASGTRVFATNYVSNDVSVIYTDTNTVIDTVNVGNGPAGIGQFISPNASANTIMAMVDTARPSSIIVSPADGDTLTGQGATISGTAADGTGSGVQKVEVSTDGGSTWHLASGTTAWSFKWNVPADGSYTIKVKATDNLGNVEIPGAGVMVIVDNIPLCDAPTVALTAPATSSNGSYTVSWGASSTAGVSYELQEATDSGFTTGLRTAYFGTALSGAITGRTDGTYYYHVRATKPGYTESIWLTNNTGCVVTIVTCSAPTTITVPATSATGTTTGPASSSTGTFTVSWGASGTSGAAYELQEAKDPSFSTGLRTAYTGTSLSTSITGRSNWTTYYYRVRTTKSECVSSEWTNASNGCVVTVRCNAPTTSLTVPATSANGSYAVSWGASETPGVGYMLQEATDSGFTTGLRTAYTGTALSASIAGRTDGTYYYRVKAVKADNADSAWLVGGAGCAVTLVICSTPATLTVPATSATGSYTVSWVASVTTGVSYVLQEATDPLFTNGLRTAYTGTSLSASITGRPNAKTFYYRVQAKRSDYISSAWRNAAKGCVVTIKCNLPGSLTVPASSVTGSYTVSWDASVTDGVTYVLQEATDALFTTGLRTAYTGTSLSASITGRLNGTTCYYRVRSTKTSYADSEWLTSANGCTVTLTCNAPASITVPASNSTGSYTLSWGASTTPGVWYELQEATNAGFTTGLRTAYFGAALSASITSRFSGTTYYYRVRVTKAGYNASVWRTGANGCAVTIVCNQPVSLTVPASSSVASYAVSWGASGTVGAFYELQEATNSGFTAGLRTAYVGNALSTSISSRTSGVTYYYRVKATKTGYTASEWRTGANGCVVTMVCKLPASLTVPASSATGSYTVSWGASSTTGTIYELQEATNSGFTSGLRTAFTGAVLSASITTRSNGTTYYYRVRATKTGYTASDWVVGGVGCAVTLICNTPTTMTIPSSSAIGSYTVSWSASSTTGVSYELQEATDADFTLGLRTAYTGATRSVLITGRSTGTAYYYRVRATKTGYTTSDWLTGGNACQVE